MDIRRRTGTKVQTDRGSKRICQERFVCEGDQAELECRDCGTRQCRQCEQRLHASGRTSSHVRRDIVKPDYTDGTRLCGMWCYPYNVAEFQCLECKNLMCGECNRAFHRGKLSKHHRAALPKPVSSELTNQGNDDHAKLEQMTEDIKCSDTIAPKLKTNIKVIEETQVGLNLDLALESSPESLFLDALPPPLAALPKPSFPNRSPVSYVSDIESDFASFDNPLNTTSGTDSGERGNTIGLRVQGGNVITSESRIPFQDPFFSFDDQLVSEEEINFNSGHFSQDSIGQRPFKTHSNLETVILNPPSSITEEIDLMKNMDLKTPQDFYNGKTFGGGMDDLIVPEFSEIDRGFGGRNSRSDVKEEGLKIAGRALVSSDLINAAEDSLQNVEVSLNLSPPSSLDSNPDHRYKQRKEARVRAIQRNEVITEIEKQPHMERKLKKKVHPPGFLLVDENEQMQVEGIEDLIQNLRCTAEDLVKVVSIFGNTGDGKSFTLNHTFYDGCEVFATSDAQNSCTMGVWAAYNKEAGIITIDTEGLLGSSLNENQRMRLLLKILALSDVVIYRTCADRLHHDLYRFLGDASVAYTKHFQKELQQALQKCNTNGFSSIGPAVIVFQETKHTMPLGMKKDGKPADTVLQEEFHKHGYELGAFSCLHYVGIQTVHPPTNFSKLRSAIIKCVEDRSVRSPRRPSVIFQALKVLNSKFSGEITKDLPATFPDEYFTCPEKCMSCNVRCECSMNHLKENIQHSAKQLCKYEHQYDNKVFICKSCYDTGKVVEVVPKTSSAADASWMGLMKYAWSGYVLECPHCGIIYRSREKWYGNLEPEMVAVRTEIRHVWKGGRIHLQGTHNAARKLVDGLSTVVGTISTVSAKPTKVMSQWLSDQIAPTYWKANADITHCHVCHRKFEDTGEPIHHCRSCGDGVCDDCSQHKLPIPERGWGETPVRVCDICFKKKSEGKPSIRNPSPEEEQVTARYVGEVFQNTFSTLGTAVSYPLGYMVSAARPAYWIPDEDITHCNCCQEPFGPKLKIHHCRGCGHGVCNPCSQTRRPVPSRGWDEPVRVCLECDKSQSPL